MAKYSKINIYKGKLGKEKIKSSIESIFQQDLVYYTGWDDFTFIPVQEYSKDTLLLHENRIFDAKKELKITVVDNDNYSLLLTDWSGNFYQNDILSQIHGEWKGESQIIQLMNPKTTPKIQPQEISPFSKVKVIQISNEGIPLFNCFQEVFK